MTKRGVDGDFEVYARALLDAFPEISDEEIYEMYLEYKMISIEELLLPEMRVKMAKVEGALENVHGVDDFERAVCDSGCENFAHLLILYELMSANVTWSITNQLIFINGNYLRCGKLLDVISIVENETIETEGVLSSIAGSCISSCAYAGTTIFLQRLMKLPACVEKMEKILEKILDSFAWVSGMVENFQVMLNSIKKCVLDMVQKAISKLEWFSDNFGFLFPIFSSVFLVCSLCAMINLFLSSLGYSFSIPTNRLFEIAAVAATMYAMPDIAVKLLSLTRERRENFLDAVWTILGIRGSEAAIVDSTVEARTESGDFLMFSAIISFVTFFTNWDTKGNLFEMMRWSSAFKGASDGFEKFKKASSDISLWAYEKFGLGQAQHASDVQLLLLNTGIDLEKWCDDVDNLIIRGNTSQVPMEQLLTDSRLLMDHYKKIIQFSNLQTSNLGYLMRERLKSVGKALTEFESSLCQAKAMGVDRLTPFCFCVYSLPGMGKSIMMKRFKADFLDMMEEPLEGREYTRSPGDKFWSGYLKQTLVYYDDFSQCQQRDGGHDELDLIPLISSSAHSLNMAELNEKGRSFTSKYVFLSTNRLVEANEVILADVNAFRRRRHLMVRLEHAAAVERDIARPFDHLRFRRLDPLHPHELFLNENGVRDTYLYTYQELVDLTVRCAKEHNEREKALHNMTLLRPRVEAPNEYFSWFSCPARFAESSVECPHLKDDAYSSVECYGTKLDHRVFTQDGSDITDALDWTPHERKCFSLTAERQQFRDILDSLHMSALVDPEPVDSVGVQCLFDNTDKKYLSAGVIRCPELYMEEKYRELWTVCSDRTKFLITLKAKYWVEQRSTFQACKDSFTTFLKNFKFGDVWSALPTELKWLTAGLALLSLGAGLFWAIRGLLNMAVAGPAHLALAVFTGAVTEGTSSGGDERVARVRTQRVRAFVQSEKQHVDMVSPESIEKIRSALCYVQFHDISGAYTTCCGYFIGPRKIVLTTHDMCRADLTRRMCLVDAKGDVRVCTFNPRLMHIPEENGRKTNLCVLTLPATQNAHANAMDNVVYDYIQKMPRNVVGWVLPNLRPGVPDVIQQTYFTPTTMSEELHDPRGGKKWPSSHLFEAPTHHAPGFCGRLALVKKDGGYSVVGMHVGGATRMAQEWSYFSEFYGALSNEKPVVQGAEELVLFNELVEKEKITDMVEKIGFLSVPVPKLEKSQIVKSPIHDALVEVWRAPKTENTILSATDPRAPTFFDPYAVGVRKFEKETGPFSFKDSDEERVLGEILHTWRSETSPFELPTVTSMDVALNGVAGLDFAEALPIATSEGFPGILSRKPGETGKFRFIDEDETGKRVLKPEILETCELIEKSALSGDLSIYAIACAKDEKTKIEKVRVKPKTRIFEILPFEFNLVIRKYFLFWMQWMMKLHTVLPCKVGLNPYSQNWDLMAYKHKKFNNHFCGDYSGFDTGTNVELMLKLVDIINDFAGDGLEVATIRRNLMRAAVTRKLIIRNDVYQIKGGTPSGFALTVMINSLVNEFYIRLAWKNLVPHKSLATYDIFSQHVHFSVYGDDNVVSFSDDVKLWYNLETISGKLKERGVILTDGRKSGKILPSQTFEEIDFLKRKWVETDLGIYLCPLDKIAIEEQLFWIRQGRSEENDPIESLEVNCVNVLREAFFHGVEYWLEIFSILIKGFSLSGLPKPILPTFKDCEQFWRDQREGAVLDLPVEISLDRRKIARFVQGAIVQELDGNKSGGQRANVGKNTNLCLVVSGKSDMDAVGTPKVYKLNFSATKEFVSDIKRIEGPVHFVDNVAKSKFPSEQAHVAMVLHYLVRNLGKEPKAVLVERIKPYLCLVSDRLYNRFYVPCSNLIFDSA
uniref:RNA1 polyprotein n=1 Tax=Dendrobium palpebrae cholivirus TaxID=3115809 RepID=A0AAT9J7W0_9SECO